MRWSGGMSNGDGVSIETCEVTASVVSAFVSSVTSDCWAKMALTCAKCEGGETSGAAGGSHLQMRVGTKLMGSKLQL